MKEEMGEEQVREQGTLLQPSIIRDQYDLLAPSSVSTRAFWKHP